MLSADSFGDPHPWAKLPKGRVSNGVRLDQSIDKVIGNDASSDGETLSTSQVRIALPRTSIVFHSVILGF